ncbi:hypothetical protein V8D89_012193 [Ganoderma adspersum]
MPLQHAQFDLSKPGLSLVDASGTYHSFTWAQVHEFVHFDHALRAGSVFSTNLVLPGGYSFFVMLWNTDVNCPFQFSSFDTTSNATTVRRAPFPGHLLDELNPPAPTAAEPTELQFTPQHIRTIERMLWSSAECEARYLERCDSMQDRCTEDRKCKHADHRTTDEAHASKATAITSSASSIGIISVGAGTGSSGSTTTFTTQASATSPNHCIGVAMVCHVNFSSSSGPSSSRRGSSPMEEDKDAEGEEETELIPFSDSEEAGKDKAGKGKKKQE